MVFLSISSPNPKNLKDAAKFQFNLIIVLTKLYSFADGKHKICSEQDYK